MRQVVTCPRQEFVYQYIESLLLLLLLLLACMGMLRNQTEIIFSTTYFWMSEQPCSWEMQFSIVIWMYFVPFYANYPWKNNSLETLNQVLKI